MFAGLFTWLKVQSHSAIAWEYIEYFAGGVVTLGVIGEIIADHIPEHTSYKVKVHTKKLSERALAIGLALELLATQRANSINNLQVADLGNRAAQAAQKAGELGVKVDELPTFVHSKEAEIANLNGELQSMVNDEKRDSDATVKKLNDSLAKANTTLAAAQKDEASLQGSMNTINELQNEIHQITTPRVLTEQQLTSLKNVASQFRNIKFDVSAVHDSDSPDLAQSIGKVLKDDAHWDWQPRAGLDSVSADGYPQIGSAFVAGIKFAVCQSDLPTLSQPMQALFTVIKTTTDWNAQQGYNLDRDSAPRHQACGTLHIVVGSRW